MVQQGSSLPILGNLGTKVRFFCETHNSRNKNYKIIYRIVAATKGTTKGLSGGIRAKRGVSCVYHG